jgi:hypothetical protein
VLPAAGVVVVGWYVHRLGPDRLITAFRTMGAGLALLLLLPLFLYFVHTLGWMCTLSPENRRKLGLLRLTLLQIFSYGLSGMVPLHIFLSEPMKMAILRRTDYDREDFAASLLLNNTINGFAIFSVAVSGMVYMVIAIPTSPAVRIGALVVTTVMVAASIAVIAVQRRGLFTGSLALLGRLPGRRDFFERHRELTRRIDDTVRAFYGGNRRGYYLAFLCHIVEKAHGVAEFWLIFRLLGLDVGIGSCFFIFSIVSALDNILFFVQVGGMETWVSSLLAWLGLSADSINITAALFRRVRMLFWALVALLIVVTTRRLFGTTPPRPVVPHAG